jgi:hypothetical protein
MVVGVVEGVVDGVVELVAEVMAEIVAEDMVEGAVDDVVEGVAEGLAKGVAELAMSVGLESEQDMVGGSFGRMTWSRWRCCVKPRVVCVRGGGFLLCGSVCRGAEVP